jgi:sporulation protein YlmC with PRC-barrel domain
MKHSMKRLKRIATTGVVILFSAGGLSAFSAMDEKDSSFRQRASELLGMEVVGNRDQQVGEVEKVMLTGDRMSIDYLVIALDDDMKPARLALSPDKVSLSHHDKDQKRLALRSSVEGLRKRYGIQGDDILPHRAGADQPKSLSEQEADMRSLETILGMDVNGPDKKDIGHIEDLLFDLQDGKIQKATISMGGFLGFNAKLASVEWSSVSLQPQQDMATIDINKKSLMKEAMDSKEYWKKCCPQGSRSKNAGYEKGMEKKLQGLVKQLDKRIERLQDKGGDQSRKQLNQLQNRRKEAKDQLGQLKDATDESWDKLQSETKELVDEIEQELRKMNDK